MTTPRPHAELAALYFADDTLKCWVQYPSGYWLIADKPFSDLNAIYHVGHEPPPPSKRTITLTVNGREWVLPEPFRTAPEKRTSYWINTAAGIAEYTWQDDVMDNICFAARRIYASRSDAQAWADFDKWCREGGL